MTYHHPSKAAPVIYFSLGANRIDNTPRSASLMRIGASFELGGINYPLALDVVR